jgi:hypothetical protein
MNRRRRSGGKERRRMEYCWRMPKLNLAHARDLLPQLLIVRRGLPRADL